MVVQINTPRQQTNPDYKQFPLYSESLRLLISNGSYVLVDGEAITDNYHKSRNGELIVQLTSYDSSRNEMYGNLLLLLRNIRTLGTAVDKNGATVRRIRIGIAADIEEVVKTSITVTASIPDIVDVCYVFNTDDVSSGNVFGLGIRNCYICRYSNLDNNPLQLTEHDYEPPFVSDTPEHNEYFDECTSSVLWNGISSLQDVIWKALNRYAERQGNWSKIKCEMNRTLLGQLSP